MTADHPTRPGQHDPHKLLELAEQLGMLGTDQATQLRDELAQGRLAGSGDELRQRLGLPAAVFEALLSIGGQGDSLSRSEERSLLTQMIRAYHHEVTLRGPAGKSPESQEAQTLGQFIDQAGLTIRVDRSPLPRKATATDKLGRYPITGHLGEGGMGQILQIRDDNVGREIAAKVIRGQADPQALAKFIREAQITGQLEHPNIVPMHELERTAGGQIYFTMKRIEGQDLAALLDRQSGGEDRTLFEYLQIFLKICDALSLAHSKGVIHRDLKPANIMVGGFGEVQVMDWGLARLAGQPDTAEAGCTLDLGGGQLGKRVQQQGASAEPLKTIDGTVVGTPCYMPPEQARGEISKLDRRADVYSLGAILYQMLTQELPFEGKSVFEVLQQVTEGQLIAPSQRTPQRDVPRELEAVVLKAMSSTPAKRYDTVALLQQDIDAYLEGRLLQAADYSTWQVAKKWAVRHKPAVAATAGILLAVISAFFGITYQWNKARKAGDLESEQRKLAEAEKRKAVRALIRLQREKTFSAKLGREKGQEQQRREAADLVRKAMEIYTRKGDRDKVLDLLAKAKRQHPNHSGVLRLRGRIELDQNQPDWAKAKSFLDRALEQDAKDYVTHFLFYRWYAQQGRGNTGSAQKHVLVAAEYGTHDSAIGLWGLAKREYDKAQTLSGIQKTKALKRGVEFCTQALTKRPGFAWALMCRAICYGDLERWRKALADYQSVIDRAGWSVAHYNRGNLHRRMKRYGEALEDYDKAISIAPRDARPYYNRGLLHETMKRYDKALADYDRAIRIDPRYVSALINRGLLHKAKKRYDKALADYDKAIRIEPRSGLIYVKRGHLHQEMKRYDKALADHDNAISIDPRNGGAYVSRAVVYEKMKRYEKALANYDKAIRIDSRLAKAYNNRGNLHRMMERYDKALIDLDKAIRIDSQYAEAYVNRGAVHMHMKRHDKALADFDKAIRIDSHHPDAYISRANLHREMKRYDKAMADFDRAIRIDPRHTRAYDGRGNLHLDMERYDKALEDFAEAIRIDPRYARAYYHRGNLYHQLKRYAKAAADFDQTIRLKPRHSESYCNRGLVHAKMKRYGKALADYDKAISIDPRDAKTYNNRGNLHLKLKRYGKALADYEKAISIDPRDAKTYANLGSLHYTQKRYRLAIADWERALPLVRGTAMGKRLIGYIRLARSKIK